MDTASDVKLFALDLKVYYVEGFQILTPTQLSYKDCHLSNKAPITELDLKSRCPNMTFSPQVP